MSYVCTIVKDMRRKTARLVSAKAVLAARVDASHESTDGKVGADFLADIEGKLEKLQEPPPVKAVKVCQSYAFLSTFPMAVGDNSFLQCQLNFVHITCY